MRHRDTESTERSRTTIEDGEQRIVAILNPQSSILSAHCSVPSVSLWHIPFVGQTEPTLLHEGGVMYWLPAVFALLVMTAGWYYLFYSPAATRLTGVESDDANRLRIRLRR